MNSRRLVRSLGVLALLLATPLAQAAVPTAITKLPYTIKKPGRYNLSRTFNFTGEGAAITIDAENVILDLQDWTLECKSPLGFGTSAEGVHVNDKRNVIVRNGTIRGFFRGIYFANTLNENGSIENVRLSGCTFAAIQLYGNNGTVRNCRITSISDSTVYLDHRVGIEVSGSGMRVLDNEISGVIADPANAHLSYGIRVIGPANGAFIKGNRIIATTVEFFGTGIHVANGSGVIVAENLCSGYGTGILFIQGGSNLYRDNTVVRGVNFYANGGVAVDGGGNE